MQGLSEADILRIARQTGVDGLELHADRLGALSPTDAAAAGQRFRAAGLAPMGLHLPLENPADLADASPRYRRRAVSEAVAWMERAAALGCDCVVVHPGEGGARGGVLHTWQHGLASSLEVLLSHAEALGLSVALENLAPRCPGERRFGSLPEHFAWLDARFHHARLGFCYDVAHACIACGMRGALELLDVVGPRVLRWHLADTPGDRDLHLAPGRGAVPFASFFAAASELETTAPYVIEGAPFGPGAPYALEAWSALVDDTRDLLDPVGAAWDAEFSDRVAGGLDYHVLESAAAVHVA